MNAEEKLKLIKEFYEEHEGGIWLKETQPYGYATKFEKMCINLIREVLEIKKEA